MNLNECVLQSILTTRTDLFGQGAVFESFEVEECYKKDGFQSSQLFGRIVYRQGNQTKHSSSLILKVTPPATMMKQFSTLQFFNEVIFYTRILPFFQTAEPQAADLFSHYYGSLLQYRVESDEAVIVFENLQAEGYSPPAKHSFLDYDHLRLMMGKLGVFHAHSYRARQEAPNVFHAIILSHIETNGQLLRQFPSLSPIMMRGLRPLTTDPHYSSKLENLHQVIDDFGQIYERTLTGDERNRTHVLCHGDFLSSNLLFAYEEGKPIDLKMVDLATWRFASPAVDLALVLYMHADQQMRDKNWDNLIDEYYAALCSTFPSISVPSKDSILAEFKVNVMAAYAVASYYLFALIARDHGDASSILDLLPAKYEKVFADVPPDVFEEILEKAGGERGITALSNILKDIIDREFV